MSKLKQIGKNHYSFVCPGCGEDHTVGPGWKFNGNLESPTFSPSLLVKSGCKSPRHKQGDECWCTYNAELVDKGEQESGFSCYVCHSFITDGKIQFLGDCTHSLAGKTVELLTVE